ncbi:AraC family transcriptional regulator [Shimia sagamensis]|uniref:Transcriptional regulator, AraC family n=1 Tax=Shimia sagamensis TaxID=1566352 RepID=A0ABY1NK33_9RHOB|nr:AraC family transcriptional regulator [Shimia sagamensis]SMP09714.1 transcriptional regulator, AraC family [Shimia sagamensis]
MKNPLVPAMSVAFLQPFFEELLRRGVSKTKLAARVNLKEEALFDPAISLPANTVYALLAWVARSTNDPLICACIGQRMASGAWAPLLPLMVSATSVGDFFFKFSMMSSETSRAATYKLETEGQVSLWRLQRADGASNDACYADAVAVGFFVGILKSAAGTDWEPSKVIAALPDTSIVPQGMLPSSSVLSGQDGLILRFPTAYLTLNMPSMSPPPDLLKLKVPNELDTPLSEIVRRLIEHRIAEPGLCVDDIARDLTMSRWKLQSLLKEEGWTFSDIKEEVRQRLALEEVGRTKASVASIASSLGYTNSSNFTRAFRGWTGKAPRDYRKTC